MLVPNTDPHALADTLSGFHLIGGELVAAQSGETFSVLNPATGAAMGHAAAGDEADVNLAVAGAVQALDDGRRQLGPPGHERGLGTPYAGAGGGEGAGGRPGGADAHGGGRAVRGEWSRPTGRGGGAALLPPMEVVWIYCFGYFLCT